MLASPYSKWLRQSAYVGLGLDNGTIEDAMLHFFYNGLSPWITGFGYRWSQNENSIAKKFLNLCYTINTTTNRKSKIIVPEPRHRNYEEDRETFDYFVDMSSFSEFLETWKFRNEVVGRWYDMLLREFCYIWIDVTSGKPGAFTQRLIDAENESNSDEELGINDTWSSKKKWDLY